jgi:diguanylate cyclase (GGDEF)-like protein
MARGSGFFRRVTRPTIANGNQLATYVIVTTLVCFVVAFSADVINQLTFFEDWPTTIRNWIVTALVTLLIAVPVSWAIGRAHLELYRAKLAVEELSRADPLTGLLNRRAIFEIAERTALETMVLVIFDIDRFKRVNDAHGHLAGDEVIRMVAHMMEDELGSLGYVGRIGGEEFALVGSGIDIDRLVASLAAFKTRVGAAPIVFNGGAVTVTLSAGAAYRGRSGSLNELYAEADRALYAAKALGRNRITYSRSFEALLDRTTERDEKMWRDDANAEFRRRTTDNGESSSSAA